jgi:hypothetical protein
MSTRRVRNEIQLWRINWQQVETFLDRVAGARDEDYPLAIRCKALFDAAVVIERLRLRREGVWMPHPLRMGLGGGSSATIKQSHDDRKYDLPGPLEIEMAAAGLVVDDEGKPEGDPPRVWLVGSEKLFDLWDADSKSFTPMVAPDYVFGKLLYPPSKTVHPWIPGLYKQQLATPEIGKDKDSDDSLFSYPRRVAAAEEGFVYLKPWKELRSERFKAIGEDEVAAELTKGQPDFASIADLIQSASYSAARALVQTARAYATQDIQSLQAGISHIEEDDPEDDALVPLRGLKTLISGERDTLQAMHQRLSGSVTTQDRQVALAQMGQLPSMVMAALHAAQIYDQLEQAIDTRVAYPDGPLRSVRALEWGMLKMWRSKAPWFEHRLRRVLEPRMRRYIEVFEKNLASLVQHQTTLVASALVGLAVDSATAAGSDKLPLAGGPHDLGGVRAGHLAVLDGARPALAVILGHTSAAGNRQRLRILPLCVSQARGIGLDGIPGLVQAGVKLQKTLSPALTGDELCRGVRAGEPEGNGIPQQVVALWSRLKLVRGARFSLALPQPFAASLSLPVHANSDEPLGSHASSLLLPTAPFDSATDPPQPLVATPGEMLLLRGRDADGLWWQAAVEASSAQVTTMEAQGATAVSDPQSPLCCQPETPVVLVTLSMNTMPVELVDNVTLHRDFVGFGWPSLAVGKLLPTRIDPDTAMIAAQKSGDTFRFVAATSGDLVDRTPELQAAAQFLDRWLGEP